MDFDEINQRLGARSAEHLRNLDSEHRVDALSLPGSCHSTLRSIKAVSGKRDEILGC